MRRRTGGPVEPRSPGLDRTADHHRPGMPPENEPAVKAGMGSSERNKQPLPSRVPAWAGRTPTQGPSPQPRKDRTHVARRRIDIQPSRNSSRATPKAKTIRELARTTGTSYASSIAGSTVPAFSSGGEAATCERAPRDSPRRGQRRGCRVDRVETTAGFSFHRGFGHVDDSMDLTPERVAGCTQTGASALESPSR